MTEYILKPVNGQELTRILKKVRVSLDQEISQRRDIDALRESYLGSLPILRELFLNDLVRQRADRASIEPKLKEYAIDILDARKWLAAVIHVEQIGRTEGKAFSHHQELIPISVRRLAEDHLRPYCRFVMFNSTDGITMITAIDDGNTQTGLINMLNDICRESRRLLEVAITVGVGHSCGGLEEIARSYESAVDALGYQAIVGKGKAIYINDVEPVSRGKLQLEGKEEEELIGAVKFGPRDAIVRVIGNLASRMDDAKVHARQYQVYMLSIVNCMTRLMQQYDLNMNEMFDGHALYEDILEGTYRREEFADKLISIACRMNEAMNQERDNTAKG